VIPWFKWPFYAIAELAGAFVAAAVQYGIYYGKYTPAIANYGMPTIFLK